MRTIAAILHTETPPGLGTTGTLVKDFLMISRTTEDKNLFQASPPHLVCQHSSNKLYTGMWGGTTEDGMEEGHL